MRKFGSGPIYVIGAVGALLMVVVIGASAYLRLVQLGLGCDAWPSCYGLRVLDPRALVALDGGGNAALRLAHRLAASGVALLALAALVLALRARLREAVATGAALVGLAAALAVLGRATGSSIAPAVAAANVLGGMAMLALFCRLALAARAPPVASQPQDRRVRALAVTALTVLAYQITLGVLTSAQLAGRACPELFSCPAARHGLDLSAFNPLRLAGTDEARAALHLAHRAGAALTLLAVLSLALAVWRRHPAYRVRALALAVLTATQFGIGTLLVLRDLPLPAATAHDVLAAALIVAVVWTGFYWRSTEASPVSAACQMRTSNQPSGTKAQR